MNTNEVIMIAMLKKKMNEAQANNSDEGEEELIAPVQHM